METGRKLRRFAILDWSVNVLVFFLISFFSLPFVFLAQPDSSVFRKNIFSLKGSIGVLLSKINSFLIRDYLMVSFSWVSLIRSDFFYPFLELFY